MPEWTRPHVVLHSIHLAPYRDRYPKIEVDPDLQQDGISWGRDFKPKAQTDTKTKVKTELSADEETERNQLVIKEEMKCDMKESNDQIVESDTKTVKEEHLRDSSLVTCNDPSHVTETDCNHREDVSSGADVGDHSHSPPDLDHNPQSYNSESAHMEHNHDGSESATKRGRLHASDGSPAVSSKSQEVGTAATEAVTGHNNVHVSTKVNSKVKSPTMCGAVTATQDMLQDIAVSNKEKDAEDTCKKARLEEGVSVS